MGKPKKDSDQVTREALESYLWTSTGWRGSPDVIEAILKRVDEYTGVQVTRECAVLTMAHRKELAEAAERAAKETAAAVAAVERVQSAETVERATVEQLLEQLAEAHIDAASTLTASSKTLNAIDMLIQTLRAADGKAKDIALPGLPAADTPLPRLELVTEGDVQVAKALGAPQEELDAELGRQVDAAVEKGRAQRELMEGIRASNSAAEVLPDIAEYQEPEPENVTTVPSETFDRLMEETGPEPNEAAREAFRRLGQPDAMMVTADDDVTPEQFDEALAGGEPVELDPIAAMVAEAEADMLADGTGKRCSACGHVKSRTVDFYKDKSAPDGLMYTCRGCNASRAKARDAARAAERAGR